MAGCRYAPRAFRFPEAGFVVRLIPAGIRDALPLRGALALLRGKASRQPLGAHSRPQSGRLRFGRSPSLVGERPQLSALSAAGALQGWRGRASGFPSGRVGCVLSLSRISAFGATLRIRRYASATARGRRSRAGDSAVPSETLRPCFREPKTLPRFQPLRQPARQGAESPILPPRFSQPLKTSRPPRPRG